MVLESKEYLKNDSEFLWECDIVIPYYLEVVPRDLLV